MTSTTITATAPGELAYYSHYVLRLHFVFTALHGMQTRSSDENSVCPSVCPSITRVHCDKTGERSVQIFTPYER